MNNEMNKPVAWMWYQSKENTNPYTQMTGYSQLCFSEFEPDCNLVAVDDGTLTPLYTHPVKELKNIVVASATCSCGKVMEVTNLQPVKELTDEEIEELIWNTTDMKDFAKAILRKAQEK